MLHYAVIFLVIALIASLLGAGMIAGTALWVAKVLLGLFIFILLVSLIRGRRPRL